MKKNTGISPFLNKLIHEQKRQLFFIAFVILLLYARTLSFELIGLDEQSLLIDKKDFNKELSNIPKAFSQHVFQNEHSVGSHKAIKYYRPLLTVSFIIDQQFSKKGFSFHRFSNMVIHFFAVIGLLFVFQQMKVTPPIAFLFSLLFTLHPLFTPTIAWIPGRNDSLVCAFILWSFYFLMNYFQNKSGKNLFLHLFLFACALFTKENAVMFVILSAFSIFLLQGKNLQIKNKMTLLLSYCVIVLVWFFMRKNALNVTTAFLSVPELYHTFLKNFPLLFQYFQKTILPVNLAVMSTVEDTSYGWVCIAFVLFAAGIYFTKKISWAEIIFGLTWFFLFLLPTLLFSYYEGMEHRSYLPVAGLLIAFAHTDPLSYFSLKLKKLLSIFGIFILILGVITFFRVRYFANELVYWESAASSSEHSAVVSREYGVTLMLMGDNKNAELAFLEGIRRNPKEVLVHYNLGVLYFKMNRLAESEYQFLQELSIDSTTNALSYHILGVIYKQTGRIKQAKEMWEKAVSINPNCEPAKNELMNYYSHPDTTTPGAKQ